MKFSQVKQNKPLKEIIGFDNDIIYIVKGDSFSVKDNLKELGARFRRDTGWYFGSFAEKPDTLPAGLELVTITWDEVGNEDGSLKNEDIVKQVIDSKLYEADPSEYVGEIGERIEVSVIVEAKREFESLYGSQFCYSFRDNNKNCYTWFTSTSSKTSFVVGEEVTIRGSIKSHDIYKNKKSTVLSRVNKKG